MMEKAEKPLADTFKEEAIDIWKWLVFANENSINPEEVILTALKGKREKLTQYFTN